jgi:hypothetical protein
MPANTARLVKKLDPIENAGHRQNGPNWVGTTLSASFQADVTSCYVKFRQTFLGPSAHPATIIEFKQIEFSYLTGLSDFQSPDRSGLPSGVSGIPGLG